MAEDEPRCEQLRAENLELRARMFATKETQVAAVQEVENLKAEKTALVERKVSPYENLGFCSFHHYLGSPERRDCEYL